MRITYRKRDPILDSAVMDRFSVVPITIDGERLECVREASVKSLLGEVSLLTVTFIVPSPKEE